MTSHLRLYLKIDIIFFLDKGHLWLNFLLKCSFYRQNLILDSLTYMFIVFQNTNRELFYQNVSRLRNQVNLDVAVRDVCCLLESPPWNLGIVATSKGLIAGPLTIHARNGNVVDCMASNGKYYHYIV